MLDGGFRGDGRGRVQEATGKMLEERSAGLQSPPRYRSNNFPVYNTFARKQ